MWIFIVIVLIVIILVAVVKNDNKQIQIDHLQNGGFRKSYPLVTKCLEEEFEMSFFEDLGNRFSYSKTVIDANNRNGTLFVGLELNSGRETIIFSTYISSDGVKHEGMNVSTIYESKKNIVSGINISLEKLQNDRILPILYSQGLIKENVDNIKIIGTEAVIHLKTAGSLKQYLFSENQKKITQLTLSGEINGTDIRVLRYMSGNDENGRHTTGFNLQTLDISNTRIVEGGDYYYCYEDYGALFYLKNIKDSVGELTFSNCSNLKSIFLPNNVTSIEEMAFNCCGSLQNITLPNNLVSIGKSAFSFNHNLKSFTLPLSLEIIECDAFSLSGIDFISIPENVKRIGKSAFENCWRLTSVVINNGIEIIEERAFNNCKKMNEITIKKEIPIVISNDVFEGVSKSTCILKVPIGAKEEYQKSPVWSEFEKIVEI